MDQSSVSALYTDITLPLFRVHTMALLLLICLPLSAAAGFISGRRRRKKQLATSENIDPLIGEATFGGIMALLSLLLAFTFGHALTLAYQQEQTLIGEASAIGTAFLRADYLPEPGRIELKAALLDYAKTRVLPEDGQLNSTEKVYEFLQESMQAQSRLWPLTLEATTDPVPEATKFFIAGAINDVLDSHLERMQLLSVPVSDAAKGMMLICAVATLILLGNRAGLAGRPLTWRTFVFAGFLFFVMTMVIDLQRGEDGLIRLDDGSLLATIAEMELSLAGSGRH